MAAYETHRARTILACDLRWLHLLVYPPPQPKQEKFSQLPAFARCAKLADWRWQWHAKSAMHPPAYAREAVELPCGQTRADLASVRLSQRALVRPVQVGVEAAAHIPGAGRARHPSLPWKDVVGMENRLSHSYAPVDWEIRWNTVTMDWPELDQDIEAGASRVDAGTTLK